MSDMSLTDPQPQTPVTPEEPAGPAPGPYPEVQPADAPIESPAGPPPPDDGQPYA